MNREELEALLRDVESDHVERTRSFDKADKFGEAITCFCTLITGGGRMLPSDRNPASAWSSRSSIAIPVGDPLCVGPDEQVAGPAVSGHVVRESAATESEERILAERRAALAKTWDARPCPEGTLADLALDLFALSYRPFAVSADVIHENHRPLESQLAALRFYDARLNCPTNAGVLLFAKDPIYFFAGAYAQYVRYAGATLADEVSRERRFTGDLLSVLRGLDELAVEVADSRPEALPSGRDRTVSAYPSRAIHELVMNAIIHRNYDGSTTPVMVNHFEDRIEIRSPGGLYGDLTKEIFPNATSYRNPVIAEAAKTLGFVNRYGRGIATAQDVLAKNDSAPAEFEIAPNQVVVTVRRRP